MTRFKVLGLALVAIFSMGALASSAMALSGIEFEEPTNMPNGKVMGEQKSGTNDVLTIDGSNATCTNITYNGGTTVANGTTNVTLHPEYSSCTSFGFIGSNIDTTNCNFRIMAAGNYEEANMKWNSGETVIECGANPIKINSGSGACVATIGSQTISTGLHFTNTTASQNGDGRMDFDLVLTNSKTNIKKNVDGFGCPFIGTGEVEGTYNGTTTFSCTNTTNDVLTGCTLSNGEAPPPKSTLEIAGGNNANLMGEQAPGTTNEFVVDGSKVTCTTINYKELGETANGATNVEVHPEFSSCTAFGFIGANVSTTNCNYRGMAGGILNNTNDVFTEGELQISCGANPITINAGSGTCVATVGSQTISSKIDFSNMTVSNMTNENTGSITMHAAGASVSTSKNVDGFGCPLSGTGSTTGTYTGTTTLRCTRPAEATQYKSCTIKG